MVRRASRVVGGGGRQCARMIDAIRRSVLSRDEVSALQGSATSVQAWPAGSFRGLLWMLE